MASVSMSRKLTSAFIKSAEGLPVTSGVLLILSWLRLGMRNPLPIRPVCPWLIWYDNLGPESFLNHTLCQGVGGPNAWGVVVGTDDDQAHLGRDPQSGNPASRDGRPY